MFQTLREWGTETAREEGVPPYVVLTNKQLLAILERSPESPTALGNVPGIGANTVKRYGKAILRLLRRGGSR